MAPNLRIWEDIQESSDNFKNNVDDQHNQKNVFFIDVMPIFNKKKKWQRTKKVHMTQSRVGSKYYDQYVFQIFLMGNCFNFFLIEFLSH